MTSFVADVRYALHVCLWARPVVGTHAPGIGGDLLRSRAQLLAGYALLRQQLLALRSDVARPDMMTADYVLLVVARGAKPCSLFSPSKLQDIINAAHKPV